VYDVGKPDGNRPLERPRHRCVVNIKIDLGETEWCGMDWISLAQDSDKWRDLVNGFHKMLRISRMAAQLVASRVVLSSTEFLPYRGEEV
jgi:hypothetical protein